MCRPLDPCSIRRPERLPSSSSSSGFLTACVGENCISTVNLLRNKVDRLGFSEPLGSNLSLPRPFQVERKVASHSSRSHDGRS